MMLRNPVEPLNLSRPSRFSKLTPGLVILKLRIIGPAQFTHLIIYKHFSVYSVMVTTRAGYLLLLYVGNVGL